MQVCPVLVDAILVREIVILVLVIIPIDQPPTDTHPTHGSPGLLMIPTTSNTSSFPPIGSEEEARAKYLIKAMSDNGVDEEYITPSTVFSQSMK